MFCRFRDSLFRNAVDKLRLNGVFQSADVVERLRYCSGEFFLVVEISVKFEFKQDLGSVQIMPVRCNVFQTEMLGIDGFDFFFSLCPLESILEIH